MTPGRPIDARPPLECADLREIGAEMGLDRAPIHPSIEKLLTLAGREAVGEWLLEPVSNVRDAGSIAPAAGPLVGGTAVVITGANLSGATAVTFGGVDHGEVENRIRLGVHQ